MGNVFSRCCPKNPCERQDEDQRLLHESVPSPQTSSKALEECPVSTDCTTPESSETPSPAEEKVADQLKAGLSLGTSAPELIPGQAAAQVQTDVLAPQVKPGAPAAANYVHMNAGSAVDNSTLVDQQEAAAGVVSQVLEDASKIVSSSGEGGVITSFASQPLVVPSGGDGPLDALHGKVESQAESMEKPEGASTMTNSQAADVGVESQSASPPIKSPTTPTSKVESLPTPAVSDGQAEGESGCSSIRSQAVPSEKLWSQDSAPTEENHAASAAAAVVVSGGQAVTEDLETHISATVTDSQATSSITNIQAVSAKIVPEIPGCSVDTENFAKITETSPPRTIEKKEVFSELQQVPAGHVNGSLVEAVLVRETAEEVIHATTKPDGTKVNLLPQYSSAEENKLNTSLSETPKGSPPSPETCVQFGLLAQQGDSSAAGGDEPGRGREATSAVPDIEERLGEGVPPHSSDEGHGVSMEGSFSESDLDLSSAPTDTSISMQDGKDMKRTEEDSRLTEEPCSGEDLSSTSGKEAGTEGRLVASASDQQMAPKDGRDSAADTDAQDVAGLTAVSSLQDLLDEEEVERKLEGEEAETQSAVSAVEDGGLATSPVDERPGSAGQSSPVESDGNELNCEEDLYRGEEEIEEEQELNKLEMTGPEGRCSLEPPVDILAYSEREWRGQTTKSAVIRKGYAVLSQSFAGLRRVRGDNYCALRATLYQALMNTTQPPDWLQQESFLLIPEELEARYGVIKDWRFPDVCKQMDGIENAVDLLKHYLGLLQKWWQEAATSPGPEGHMRVCEELFQGGVDEFGLMEALKLLMLSQAVELHAAMQSGHDVPIFCWLLFARDTSSCPRTLVANHLSQMGFSGGLEQVEMFLLGYALRHTIKAYRLYMADTEEFITHYPDDHTQDWPCLCLVTEDDRHYNVVGGAPAHAQEGLPAGLQ